MSLVVTDEKFEERLEVIQAAFESVCFHEGRKKAKESRNPGNLILNGGEKLGSHGQCFDRGPCSRTTTITAKDGNCVYPF
jgi:hypothetical protein